MKRFIHLFLFAGLACLLPAADPAWQFPRSSPEAQGISSAALGEFIATLDQKVETMNSLMVVRHGHVVAEGWWTPYAAAEPHVLYSLSKSFTSTAVGLAQAEGRLSIDDPVLKFFPDEAPVNPSENLKAMRIHDLLRMSTGHHADDIDPFPFVSTEDLVKRFLSRPVTDKPGTHFFYNSAATYMLSAIVRKATGQTVLDYLGPRLFEPLGITGPTWETSAQGNSFGAFGLSLHTEDIARFGQLYLQKGEWRGHRLLPADWVAAATSRQTANGSAPDSDWDQGYGYQFWQCRHGFYRADGAFGQYCIVMPQYDTVIVITSATRDMGGVMSLIWTRFLPELRPAPLPADAGAQARLATQLAGLALREPSGTASSPLVAKFAGRRYIFAANDAGLESLSLENSGDSHVTLNLRLHGSDQQLSCGFGAWIRGSFAAGSGSAQPLAASLRYVREPVRAFAADADDAEPFAAAGAWTTDDTYTLKLCQYRSVVVQTISLKFSGDEVRVDTDQNVGFEKVKSPTLIGRAQ
jgi:CubicO group peptidase (beta-lactamase class C family)